MKNLYKHDYPNAWKEWYEFSGMENIEFQDFYNWCNVRGLGIAIVQYPQFYSVRIVNGEIDNEFGQFEEWFDALDVIVTRVFEIVEGCYEETEEIADLYEASKELDTDETSREGRLKHYLTLVVEIGEQYRELLKRSLENDAPVQKDLDMLDSIIIIALSCKRLLTE